MTAYRPCHNCVRAKSDCERRDQIRRGIAGLGITALKFACTDRAPLFQPGARVAVTWPVPQCDEPGYQDYAEEMWPATVIAESGSRFIISVDDVPSDEGTPARGFITNPSLYAKVSSGKLRPINEPCRIVCGICGIVSGASLDECYQNGTAPRAGCLRFDTEVVL